MERLIVVSGDSHATPQPELWPEYLETNYHHLLPEAREDNERYTQLLGMFADFSPETLEVIDAARCLGVGWLPRCLGPGPASGGDGPRGRCGGARLRR